MFSMLRGAFTLLICIVCVGFYLGWLSFHRVPSDPQSNKMDINVSVDKTKVESDLQKAERNLAKRIQDINSQPQGNAQTPQPGQRPMAPALNLGPISIQPAGQSTNSQPAGPALSIGPLSIEPRSQPATPPSYRPAAPPQPQTQGPDFQFTVPLGPPPGDGR